MNEKLKSIGALSSASNNGSKTVASGVAIVVALFAPVDDINAKIILAGALPPVVDYILPTKLPWKEK